MKLLPDESVPRQLNRFFPDLFEISTAQLMGWSGRKNGDLLRLAADHRFDALITCDKGFEYQQNIRGLPIPVIIMIAYRTRVQELRSHVPEVVNVVTGGLRRRICRVES